jgi:ribosomal-protein-alanine N-acetyltransferase
MAHVIEQQIFTPRLELRRLHPAEAEEVFYAYASKVEVGRYLTWPVHQGILDTRQFLRYVDGAWKAGIEFTYGIRLRPSSRLIGAFGVRNDDGRLEIGYVLGPSFWGQGVATEACTEMVNYLKGLDDIYRIQSFVDADNAASARVLIKSGFIEEARLPKWRRFINQGNEPRDCIQFRVPMG